MAAFSYTSHCLHWEQVGPVHPAGHEQVSGDTHWPPFRHSGSQAAIKV